MGNLSASEFASAALAGDITLEQAVRMNLTSNHFPPVHEDFVPVAIDAIRLAESGDWDSTILMPNGVTKSVGGIIDGLHLHGFIDSDSMAFA